MNARDCEPTHVLRLMLRIQPRSESSSHLTRFEPHPSLATGRALENQRARITRSVNRSNYNNCSIP